MVAQVRAHPPKCYVCYKHAECPRLSLHLVALNRRVFICGNVCFEKLLKFWTTCHTHPNDSLYVRTLKKAHFDSQKIWKKAEVETQEDENKPPAPLMREDYFG